MKCPFCLANCLASDSACPACRRSFEAAGLAKAKSAMWLCVPLFMVIGAGLFIALWEAPPSMGIGTNWTHVNQIALVSLGSALVGAMVGWTLDYIARK